MADYTNYSGLAQGEALKGKPDFQVGTISRNILANKGREDKARKEREDKLAKLTDFDVTKIKDMYPALATKVTKANAQIVNEALRLWDEGKQNEAIRYATLEAPKLNKLISDTQFLNQQKKDDEAKQRAGNAFELGADNTYKILYDPNGDTNLDKIDFSQRAEQLPDKAGIINKYREFTKAQPAKLTQIPFQGKQIPVYTKVADERVKDVAANELAGHTGYNKFIKAVVYPSLPEEDKAKYDIFNENPIIANTAMHQLIKDKDIGNSLDEITHDSPTDIYHPPQPTQTERDKNWKLEGNRFYNGQNVFHYDRNDAGDEVVTFSKVNPSDNLPMVFKDLDSKGEESVTIQGIPTRFEKKKGNAAPFLYVKVTSPSEYTDSEGKVHVTKADEEIRVPYTPYNASKIENEYGKNFYQVRQAVTGTVKNKEGTTTGKSKDSGTIKSTSSGSGSSKKDNDPLGIL